jgi:hypothetical protein
MIDNEIPSDGPERLPVDADQCNDFSSAIQVKGFALMAIAGNYGDFHVALPWQRFARSL